MPGPSRQPARSPTSAPQGTSQGTSPAAPQGAQSGAPGRGVSPAGGRGNAAAQEALAGKSVAEQVPAELQLNDASVSFTLPGRSKLTGGWNPLTTTDPTQVNLTVSATGLSISFWPALLVDAVYPLSNVAWRGLRWDFRTGAVGGIDVQNTQIGLPIASVVRGEIDSFIQKLLTGTPLARAGYQPLQDQNLGATLKALQARFATSGGAGGDPGEVGPKDIRHVSASAGFTTRAEIRQGTPDGAVSIPAGAGLRVRVDLAGTGADLARGGVPGINGVHIQSDGIELQKDGAPVAKLMGLSILPGGVVDVTSFQPLGSVAKAADTESGLRGLVALFQLAAAMKGQNTGQLVDIEPGVVNGLAEKEIEGALTKALQQMILDHADAVPGVDLRKVMGVAPKG